MASTDQLQNEVRASAGTPIGKVRLGSLPSTAHPLVSTLYKIENLPTNPDQLRQKFKTAVLQSIVE